MEKAKPQFERENHLKHAWDVSKWDAFGTTPWVEIAPDETVKALTASKDGGGPPLPKAFIERVPEVAPRRFYSLPADLEACGRTKVCSGCS